MRTAAVVLLLCLSTASFAQWPQRPVKVVVPFPPGGVTDSIARITADWLAPRLGQPVIAENRPGASGAIAAEFVARADADGHTLLSAATPQLAVVPLCWQTWLVAAQSVPCTQSRQPFEPSVQVWTTVPLQLWLPAAAH